MEELYGKYSVLKMEDIEKYCTEDQKNNLSIMVQNILAGRKNEGKKPSNEYLVVNKDEKYSQDVLNMILGHQTTTFIPEDIARKLKDCLSALNLKNKKTISETAHLADGDNCTLIDLKTALRKVNPKQRTNTNE